METLEGASHPTRFADVAVTVDFHCNHACRFCIVQEGMNDYLGVPFERFEKMVEENARSGRYRRVVFTGGEVTLEKKLFQYVERARDSQSFEHIRVQTHGRRFADPAFADALVAAGVDELFVSIHGHTAEIHDDITQRPGSFDELLEGFEVLRDRPLTVLTNTVLNRRNLASIAHMPALVHSLGVRRMELWNYLPMEDHADERNLIASMDELMPRLREALDRADALGVEVVTKYVPRCLLGRHAETLDNSQPDVIIVESFWDQFPRFNCLYEGICEHSEACLGLHHPYVSKHGWEADALTPTPRTRPFVDRAEQAATPSELDREGGASEATNPEWEALLGGREVGELGRLERLLLTRNEARFTYRLPSEAAAEVVLDARDDDAKAYARTPSFNVFHARFGGDPAELHALLGELLRRLEKNDRGELTLDGRKGLVKIRTRPHQRD